jgi:hypothetical protein
MKPPGAPRQPLGEVSPNQRSRVVGAYDHGIKVPAIARRERLTDSTCRSIIQNASHQVSCITPTRKGAPSVLTPGDHRLIRRAIVVNPKITAQQLFVQCAPHSSKKTIYRYLLNQAFRSGGPSSYPPGVTTIVASSFSCFLGRIDENTVLKYPHDESGACLCAAYGGSAANSAYHFSR